MLSLVLCMLFAVAPAAPFFGGPFFGGPFYGGPYQPPFMDNIFNTHKFLDDLSQNMNHMMSDLAEKIPNHVTTQEYDGNQYKITISLQGFEEKDITLKNRDGLLIVEAIHTDGLNNVNSFMHTIILPDNVNPAWRSEFQNGVLTIVFPLKSGD